MKKAALITGGAGFIGSNLIKALTKSFDKLICIDNLSRGKKEYLKEVQNLHFINEDLSNYNEIKKHIDQLQTQFEIDEVWHLVANSDIPSGVANAEIDLKDTFLCSHALCKCFEKIPPKKIIFASSSAVYGDMGDALIDEKSAPLFPISNYGAMKLASEAYLSAWIEKTKSKLIIFRFPNVVGTPATHGVIYDFLKRLIKDKTSLQVLGNGFQMKPYLLCDDLIQIMIFLKSNIKNKREVFNIGPSDAGVFVKDIAKTACEIAGDSETTINYEDNDRGWIGDVPKFKYDIRKLQQAGWSKELSSIKAIKIATKQIFNQLKN
jgi:UDP-glucose 4-epimerase